MNVVRACSAVAVAIVVALALGAVSASRAAGADRDAAVPHYDHILVIVEENKGYATVLDHGYAPAISDLAKTYGMATEMFAERHPSEPNYVALVGGDTFGIADDDAWYCTPGSTQQFCKGSDAPGFPVHLIDGPNLATQ